MFMKEMKSIKGIGISNSNSIGIHKPFTWCIEMKTIEIPSMEFIVKVWPNKTADVKPVKIVTTIDEYFFKMVSALHKQIVLSLKINKLYFGFLYKKYNLLILPAYLK